MAAVFTASLLEMALFSSSASPLCDPSRLPLPPLTEDNDGFSTKCIFCLFTSSSMNFLFKRWTSNGFWQKLELMDLNVSRNTVAQLKKAVSPEMLIFSRILALITISAEIGVFRILVVCCPQIADGNDAKMTNLLICTTLIVCTICYQAKNLLVTDLPGIPASPK